MKTARPVVMRFVLGRGRTKARKESEDTARAVVEQVSIALANTTFDAARDAISDQVEQDVRAELVHIMKLFRRYIIGISGSKRGPTGILSTVTKGSYAPSESLGSRLPSWAPRGSKYLSYKRSIVKHTKWFLFDGELQDAFRPEGDGQASANGGGGDFTGLGGFNQTFFEDMFGPISVQVVRNNSGWGVVSGAALKVGNGRRVKMKLGTIRVRALGSLTSTMLNPSSAYNAPLMSLVGREDPRLSVRLGNRWRYRPTLEPFLSFFLERSIGQAVTERLRRGVLNATLFRRSGREIS